MAHESFEDQETADVMNGYFVNIKVDREEYPDVDSLYMNAVQAMSGSGGWPMSVFLTPDGSPLFGGTYFPKEPGRGRPTFKQVLESVNQAWKETREDVVEQAEHIRNALNEHAQLKGIEPNQLNTAELLAEVEQTLIANADTEWGGIGQAPKFPQTHALSLLLWFGARGNNDAKDAALISLDAMASGGIYDHLGGGFARYSTDPFWMVPHFEKMLYDQAQLTRIYTDAYLLTRNENYRMVVTETVDYVLRDLRSPDGLFYSAEDADSEGEEGAFYIWRQEEIEDTCGANAAALIEWYGVTKSGNFEGRNILHRPERGNLVRTDQVESARQNLFELRNRRERPGLDNKVITEWNALFIGALADAGRHLGIEEYIEAATTALEQFNEEPSRIFGSDIPPSALDFAALTDAATRVYEATGELKWLHKARLWADALLEMFFDNNNGAFYLSGNDDLLLFTRSKDIFDGATASATSFSTLALIRLAALTDIDRYRLAADKTISLLAKPLQTRPLAFAALLNVVAMNHFGITQVVIPDQSTELFSIVDKSYAPRVVNARGETGDSSLWQGREKGKSYVCHDFVCDLPAQTPAELSAQLEKTSY